MPRSWRIHRCPTTEGLLEDLLLGFPTEDGRFLLDTDASLFAVGGVLNQIQDNREVVIEYASRSLRLSQRRYCIFVSSGGSVHLSYGSKFSPMATEVS